MRFLDRRRVSAPACLARYQTKPTATWKNLIDSPKDHEEVRAALIEMQGPRCAYCDCDLSKNAKRAHVEHFVQRHRRRSHVFDWSNLFLSCSCEDCCGKHKDKHVGSYADEDLVKPDDVEPRDFIRFTSDGRVWSKNGCRQGRETIRVFALDCGRLRGMRKSYLAAIVAQLNDFLRAGLAPGELLPLKERLALQYERHPFRSAILDVLDL
jgi:uncharacterized protein (TIGR02646 family)